jgi:hypothetical protein
MGTMLAQGAVLVQEGSWSKDRTSRLVHVTRIKARYRNVGVAIFAFAVFGFGLYELSFARSSETSTIYQNPDFPCVRAINPTVTVFRV